ncbi:MAG: IS200/IS605 family transposase [Thermoplasmatales archaeon]|nr:IS200/IS605 family transposase [Thermoplasmatales archaeon]
MAGVFGCMNGTFSGGYLSKGNHYVGQNLYHFEWCTKYRYKMFRRYENKKPCETVLKGVAERHGIKIAELSVMPEHVHIVGDIPPTMSVSRAFNLLKGRVCVWVIQKRTKVSI